MTTTPSASQNAALVAYPDAVTTATDKASGITVTIETDGVTVSAKNSEGDELWRKNVIKETGEPGTGFPVVRKLSTPGDGTAILVIGKQRVVTADLRTGKLTFSGEN